MDVAPLGLFTPAMVQIPPWSVVGQKLEFYTTGSETAVAPLGLFYRLFTPAGCPKSTVVVGQSFQIPCLRYLTETLGL